MDNKTKIEISEQLKSSIDAYNAASEMSDEGGRAAAAVEIIEASQALTGRPLVLSGDPMEILKAADKLSTLSQLTGITEPAVWEMLGLTPPGGASDGSPGDSPGGPGSGSFRRGEETTSPIVLDLDGDGVETLSVDGGSYFDHEGDGFAESTGWVGADDGLLVWDRNGDGIINDGTELFGSNTLMSDGSKAENGFSALNELDSNLDGKIDQNDAAFSNLQVWQDINGDGNSTENEMYTLEQVGVSAINTSYVDSSIVDAQGNTHGQVGSFEWADGSTGDATDVWFKTNTSLSYAVESVEVSADIAALPDVQGYGTVYDLHQAMALDDTGSLQALVEAFALEQSVDGRNAILEQLVLNWTGSENVELGSRGDNIDARKLAAVEQFVGREYIGIGGSNPGQNAASHLDFAFNDVAEYTYASLMVQTHLSSIYQTVTLKWDETEERLYSDFSSAISTIESEYALNPDNGVSFAVEFVRTAGFFGFSYEDVDSLVNDVAELGSDFFVALAVYFDSLPSETIYGTQSGDTIVGRLGSDLIFGDAGDDVLIGRATDDQLIGGFGNDILDGGIGDDQLVGDFGNDILDGGTGNDQLYGNDDNDVLHGGLGDDTLDGGAGNDNVNGGMGNDTYHFDIGGGQDLINDYGEGIDRIVFGAGVSIDDVTLNDDGFGNILINVGLGGDSITIENAISDNLSMVEELEFFDGSVVSVSDLLTGGSGATNEIILGDGDNWFSDISGVDYSVTTGSGMDGFYLVGGNYIVNSGAGDDSIYLEGGNHTLNSGTGDDTINIVSGNSTIDAGDGFNSIYLEYGNHDVAAGVDDDNVSLNGGTSVLSLGDGNNHVDDISYAAQHQVTTGDGIDSIFFGDGSFVISTGGNDDRVDIGAGNSHVDLGAGNDYVATTGGNNTFVGGLGDDYFMTGTGNDDFQFGRGDGIDTISDYDWTGTGVDKVSLGADIATDQVWFSSDGNNLTLSVIGTDDSIMIEGWGMSQESRIEEFHLADASVLYENQVQQLVDAMSAFSPPAAGQLTLPPEMQTELAPVISSSWQSGAA